MKQILVKIDNCLGCKSCELTCATVHSESKNLIMAVLNQEKAIPRVKVETNNERTINLPLQCRQCQEPKCVSACMTGAMQIHQETGLVINQKEKCVGCWMCVMVCPYGAISPDNNQKIASKCDQCYTEGHQPQCVEACPTKSLKFIEIDKFNQEKRKELLSNLIIKEVE